jgi:hypothetical protein
LLKLIREFFLLLNKAVLCTLSFAAVMKNFISLPFLLKIQKFENDRKEIINKMKAEEKNYKKR